MSITRITDLHFTTPKTVKSGGTITLIVLCDYAKSSPGNLALTILGPSASTIAPASVPVQPGFNSKAFAVTITSAAGACVVSGALDGDVARDLVVVT